MTTTGTALVDQLVTAGVRRAYTVPGESFLPVIDAFERHPRAQLISTRHESGAAFMAEADGKLTGTPAVAMATRGVGAANLAIGVHTAFQDSTPMIVLLGQVETTMLGREAFQEVDLPTFYSEITKWAATAQSGDRLPELVSRAWHAATTGRPGPALIALPADILDVSVDEMGTWNPGITESVSPELPNSAIRDILDRLNSADAPIIIAGGGAKGNQTGLVALAEAVGAGVYSAFRRQDVFPNEHPQYCGHLTLGTLAELLNPIKEADAILVLGSRLSEVTTQSYTVPSPKTWIAQLDREPRVVGAVVPVDVGAAVDVSQAIDQLVAAAQERDPILRDWSHAHDAYLRSSQPQPASPGEQLNPEGVMAALVEAFPSDTIVTNDAGNFSVFAHRFWRFNETRCQLAPTSGAMGYGVPAGIAAALAEPTREVLVLAGDGGFLMTGSEVEVAVRHALNLTIVVFRNGIYGTIALHQAKHLGRTSGITIGDVEIAEMARALGATGWKVEDRQGLEKALREARNHRGPSVVDVLVDPDLLTPSTRLSSILGQAAARTG